MNYNYPFFDPNYYSYGDIPQPNPGPAAVAQGAPQQDQFVDPTTGYPYQGWQQQQPYFAPGPLDFVPLPPLPQLAHNGIPLYQPPILNYNGQLYPGTQGFVAQQQPLAPSLNGLSLYQPTVPAYGAPVGPGAPNVFPLAPPAQHQLPLLQPTLPAYNAPVYSTGALDAFAPQPACPQDVDLLHPALQAYNTPEYADPFDFFPRQQPPALPHQDVQAPLQLAGPAYGDAPVDPGLALAWEEYIRQHPASPEPEPESEPDVDADGDAPAAPAAARKRPISPAEILTLYHGMDQHEISALGELVRFPHDAHGRCACPVPGCTRTFGRQSEAVRHIWEQRKAVCERCGRKYARGDAYNTDRHQRTGICETLSRERGTLPP